MKDAIKEKFKLLWDNHEHHAVGDARKFLNKNDIMAIVLLSILAAFIITFVDFLIYLKWSTFSDSNPFKTYHPYVPWLLTLFNIIYIFCLRMKRVTYWLAYYHHRHHLLHHTGCIDKSGLYATGYAKLLQHDRIGKSTSMVNRELK